MNINLNKLTEGKFENLTDEQFEVLMESLKKEENKREVRKTLPHRDELKEVNKTIVKVAQGLGVDADEIRLAEMSTYVEDFPTFVVKVNNKLDKWKSEHATYRDPMNPENYWYSPEGGGNPPKWIRDIAGEKPKKEKNDKNSEYEKHIGLWLKKIESYKVHEEEQREAA